jgi:sugar lactone lactonase YvrE
MMAAMAARPGGVRVLAEGLALGESPRWHDGRLWVCDWGTHELLAYDADGGGREVVATVDALPFTIDWLPDGRLLVVAGSQGRLLAGQPDGSLVPYADLGGLSPFPWNEVTTDAAGNAYVNGIGFDLMAGGAPAQGFVALVPPDGEPRLVADDLAFPNGMALTGDRSTLLVAESYAGRVSAFPVRSDGSLGDRRTWAAVDRSAPDGLCLDAEGAAWFADVPNRCCTRVAEGGVVLDRVELDRGCFSCALGGPDGRTLYVVAAEWTGTAGAGAARTGQVVALEVDVPAPAR